ncbi:SDR family NAD(P)-dependent oxidoreductase [Nocardia brasiliensis]|uniref:SDR family NAD(P)-dependent oxidoreductase n=1 Tax=Nocardia brasiliensis TaxID=37326 RepID=UPI00189421CB|nr:SDR family oxidoreductase [Nocardia brasiliensis]MBF6126608.1 SDR family oxidoreductase [Nocardia brasiliensis]
MTVQQRFTGRVCVVTGAASGLGAAVATALSDEGAHVWGLDRRQGPGIIRCDVTNDHDVENAQRTVLAETPVVHHIYNGVGILPPRGGVALEDEDVAEWNQVLDTNLVGMLRILKVFGRALDSTGSASVVNMSSDQSLAPRGDALSYAVSKAAVNALTVGLAKQWVGRRTRVNAVAPGAVRTRFIDEIAGSEERRDSMHDHADRVLPLGLADPATTAALVLFLLSDDARHITGEVWRCDSAQTLLGVRF